MDELASWSRFPPALVNGRVLAFLERFYAGAPLPPLIKVLFLLGRASFLILSFLSPPLPYLSFTSRLLSSFAACLRLLSLAFASAIPAAAAVYIIVSSTKLPLSGGSMSPLHHVYLVSCHFTLFTLLFPIHQANCVLYRITNIDSVPELTVSLISSQTFRPFIVSQIISQYGVF